MDFSSVTTQVATAAFIAGLIFGAVVQKTNFCTMGGVSDMVLMGNTNRFRAWMLALAIAVLGTQALHMMGIIDLNLPVTQGGVIYLTANLGWPGAIVGGLMFGYGMTMAGGCANKTLVRIGNGNLKSFVVFLIIGISAYMTLRGLFGLARIQLETFNTNLSTFGLKSQSMVEILGHITGTGTESLRLGFTVVFVGVMLVYCFKSAKFRTDPNAVLSGLIIGAMIPVGWYITGVIGSDDFSPTPLFSFTFISPTAQSVQYMMTFTGSTIDFGIASVGGVIVGAFLVSISTRSFRLEAFDGTSEMVRHIIGATLMGVGGVLALGCTIGQGLTGMSTLALGSLIALISIILGGMWGIKALEEESVLGGLKNIFVRS